MLVSKWSGEKIAEEIVCIGKKLALEPSISNASHRNFQVNGDIRRGPIRLGGVKITCRHE